MANGDKKGAFFHAVWGMFLDMVIFLKSMTVSNGILTFARSGVPKMLPKIDTNWCQKTIPSFDTIFTKQCSQRLPKVLQKWIKNLSKIDALAHLGPRWPPRFIFDRFWTHVGPKMSFKGYQNRSKIDVLSHVVPKNLPYDFWSEIR